jgi:pimeloyl-ACP methyl ester carboxylesterase
MYFGPILRSAETEQLVNAYTIGLKRNPLEGIAERLKTCTLPVAIVWGMADGIFSKDSPDYLGSILPNVTGIMRLPEAKLFFPEEYPDVIAQEARLLWSR